MYLIYNETHDSSGEKKKSTTIKVKLWVQMLDVRIKIQIKPDTYSHNAAKVLRSK